MVVQFRLTPYPTPPCQFLAHVEWYRLAGICVNSRLEELGIL